MHQETLFAPDGAPLDIFGFSVALDGDVAVVGANFDDDLGSASGSAYVFTRAGTTWALQAKLLASDGHAGAGFGDSVAICGTTIAVGSANHDDPTSFASGSVYVFDWDGVVWRETVRLHASDQAAGEAFGISLALEGDRLLVGAWDDDDLGINSGSAYLFERTGGAWQEVFKFLPSDGAPGHEFGLALDLEGDAAAIGAPMSVAGAGAVYVFRGSGSSWTEEAKLVSSDGVVDDYFGYPVDLEASRIFIGAAGHDGGASETGAAYLFEKTGNTWVEQQRIVSPAPREGAQFGASVELQDEEAIVGAHFDDPGGIDSGATYAFELVPPWQQYCTSKLDSAGCLPQIGAMGSPSASSPSGFQVVAVDLRNQANGLFFYGLSGRAAVPFQGGTLCLSGPVRRTPVRSSGGSAPPGADCSGTFALDFNAWMASGADPRLRSGVSVNGQYWYRDPGSASGTGISKAIEFTVCD